VTVGVIEVGMVMASQELTLSGTGARVFTEHRGWVGVVTAINAASTGGFLVHITYDFGDNEINTMPPPIILKIWLSNSKYLWPPYVIGQTIIILPFAFFYLLLLLLFPRLISAVADLI